jgi:hypothetical protein
MKKQTYRYTIELDQPFFPRHLADMISLQGNLSHALMSVTDLQRSDHVYGATYQNRDEQDKEEAQSERERELLNEVVEMIRRGSFVPEYQDKATREECLGIALSHYFEWNGMRILKTACEGLEDANYSSEASVLELLLDDENAPTLARKIFEENS